MAKCKLKNGEKALYSKANNIYSKIVSLVENDDDRTGQEDNITLLQELLKKANCDNYAISAAEAQELIAHNLLQPDGTIVEEEKNIILSCLFLDRETIYVQNPIDIENTDIEIHGDYNFY